MLVTHDRRKIQKYNEYIRKEVDLIHPLVSPSRKFPSFTGEEERPLTTPDEIRRLEFMLRKI
jgi:hypothetical protein